MTDGTFILVRLPTEDRDLVVEALRAESARRQRAATRAAGELEAEERNAESKLDVRPSAVKIARALAQADRLDRAAGEIFGSPKVQELELTEVTSTPPALSIVPPHPSTQADEDTEEDRQRSTVNLGLDDEAVAKITASIVAHANPAPAGPDRISEADAIATTLDAIGGIGTPGPAPDGEVLDPLPASEGPDAAALGGDTPDVIATAATIAPPEASQ